jgi:hypothetical protein
VTTGNRQVMNRQPMKGDSMSRARNQAEDLLPTRQQLASARRQAPTDRPGRRRSFVRQPPRRAEIEAAERCTQSIAEVVTERQLDDSASRST